MYGAFQSAQPPKILSNDNSLTNISLMVHVRPVTGDGVICERVKL